MNFQYPVSLSTANKNAELLRKARFIGDQHLVADGLGEPPRKRQCLKDLHNASSSNPSTMMELLKNSALQNNPVLMKNNFLHQQQQQQSNHLDPYLLSLNVDGMHHNSNKVMYPAAAATDLLTAATTAKEELLRSHSKSSSSTTDTDILLRHKLDLQKHQMASAYAAKSLLLTQSIEREALQRRRRLISEAKESNLNAISSALLLSIQKVQHQQQQVAAAEQQAAAAVLKNHNESILSANNLLAAAHHNKTKASSGLIQPFSSLSSTSVPMMNQHLIHHQGSISSKEPTDNDWNSVLSKYNVADSTFIPGGRYSNSVVSSCSFDKPQQDPLLSKSKNFALQKGPGTSSPLSKRNVISSAEKARRVLSKAKEEEEEDPIAHDKPGLPRALYMPSDEKCLSSFQILLRKQIELFEIGDSELGASSGNNGSSSKSSKNRIQKGRVGIRCRHCAKLPPSSRPKGAVYYPKSLRALYQAAQNMAGGHFMSRCNAMPPALQCTLRTLQEHSGTPGRAGRKYWAECAEKIGIVETTTGGSGDSSGDENTKGGASVLMYRPPSSAEEKSIEK